jgi:hypothetical protein
MGSAVGRRRLRHRLHPGYIRVALVGDRVFETGGIGRRSRLRKDRIWPSGVGVSSTVAWAELRRSLRRHVPFPDDATSYDRSVIAVSS